MAIVYLGKITFVNKGAWNKATNYEIKDIILYNGSYWASLKNGNIGNEPKEGVNWTLMVKSTYQAWLEQGNQGTEEEFLNSMAHIQANWEQADKGAKDYIKNKPDKFEPKEHSHTKAQIVDFPTSIPADGGNAETVNGHTVESNVPANAKFTDTIYDDSEIKQQIKSTLEESKQYTNEQIGSIVGFDTSIAQTLPSSGVKGIIYLVPKGDGKDRNIHDEYIWVNGKFELIGNTSVDLSKYSTTEQNDIKYVAKAPGKQLSSNDYTTEEKNKLSGIQEGAEVNVNPDWDATFGKSMIINKPTIPVVDVNKKYVDDSLLKKADLISGKVPLSQLPEIPSQITIDSELSSTSLNPVQNKVINAALEHKVNKVTGKGLSTEDYTTAEKNKLRDIAPNAEANVNPDWNATSGKSQILNKPTIPTVDVTKAYVDNALTTKADLVNGKVPLSQLPEIPSSITIDSSLSSTSTNPVQNKVINTALGNKVDKVPGKGLSANDYTTTEKNKLSRIEWIVDEPPLIEYEEDRIKFSTHRISPSTGGSTSGSSYINGASSSKPGLMTASDKNKLDSIATGANKYIHPTTSGNKHIPAGGASGNILRWGSDGTAVWGKEVMSESDKKKLEQVKTIVSFSHTFENLTETSTADDIKAEFKKVNFSDIDVSSDEGLMYILIAYGLAYGDDQSINTNDQIFIGNKSCLVNGSYIQEGTKTTATLELSYIHNPGKLRTTIITGTIDETNTYAFSCKVTESGDDEYYLPYDLATITSTESKENILSKLGGSEGVKKISGAINKGKKIFIESYGVVGKIPVSSLNFIIQSWISYAVPTTTNEGTNLIYVKVSSNPEVKIVHTYGYKLPVEFFALQSSSTSDEISTAVGGEEGLKKIVKAAQDGNRFWIEINKGDLASIQRVDLMVVTCYRDNSTGDMTIGFFGKMAYLWGGMGGLILISYIKSSNTFTIDILEA